MTSETNNPPFQLTIPADKLVEKVNDYVMVLWVLLDKHGEYTGLYTTEERDSLRSMGDYEDTDPDRWQRVELTLNQLMAE